MITWTCELCGLPIDNLEGGLTVDELAATLGGEPHWTAAHYECAPGEDPTEYGFGVEELRTVEALLTRTLIVAEAGLVTTTGWTEVVHAALARSAEPRPAPPAVHIPVRRLGANVTVRVRREPKGYPREQA